jgi:hypothetical protein
LPKASSKKQEASGCWPRTFEFGWDDDGEFSKMKPIYFPYTYVPQWVAETLAACFKQFIVYQPSGRKLPSEMQPWIEANAMEVRVPVQTEDDALAKTAKEFRAFAGLHADSRNLKTAVLGGQQGAIPCFGDSTVSRIVSDVKKSRQSASDRADFDPVFCAQVFLDFAQEFDRQSAELNRDLGVNKRHSHDLLKEISGEKENGLPVTPLSAEIKIEESAEYMALDRFQAWLRLFMIDPVDSGLFVTSSPAVFNHLIENLTDSQKVMQAEGLPINSAKDDAAISWRDSFLIKLKQLIENREGAAGHTLGGVPLLQDQRSNVRLTLYLVFGQGPSDIFSRIFEDQNIDTLKPNQSAEAGNTLIGLIDRRPIDIPNTKH